MTTIQPTSPVKPQAMAIGAAPMPPVAPALGTIEIVWTSVQAAGAAVERLEIVVRVQMLDRTHAMVEAWMQSPCERRTVFPPALMACEFHDDGRLLHADLRQGDRRVVSLSILPSEMNAAARHAVRPAYAQTVLLQHLGFAPGTFDPPTLRICG